MLSLYIVSFKNTWITKKQNVKSKFANKNVIAKSLKILKKIVFVKVEDGSEITKEHKIEEKKIKMKRIKLFLILI